MDDDDFSVFYHTDILEDVTNISDKGATYNGVSGGGLDLFTLDEEELNLNLYGSVRGDPCSSVLKASSLRNNVGMKVNLVDPSLEITDPSPDVHSMFVMFDSQFFWGKLGVCTVEWSKKMTSCAGLCRFQPQNGSCNIRLSEPLLKLRPRRDLVETLLHEMIHAYLFLTSGHQDRDGHGPEFQHHMHRINQLSGTKITIYHSFHGEVAHYKTHWWRCNGQCRDRPPFYGWIKRATNRAPGPSDYWWSSHRNNCDGEFIKIKEPEKKEKTVSKSGSRSSSSLSKESEKSVGTNSNLKIDQFFPGTGVRIGGKPMNANETSLIPSTSQHIIPIPSSSKINLPMATSLKNSLTNTQQRMPNINTLSSISSSNSKSAGKTSSIIPSNPKSKIQKKKRDNPKDRQTRIDELFPGKGHILSGPK